MARPSTRLASGLLLAAALVGALLLLEGGVRLVAPQSLVAHRFSHRTGWEPRPGAAFVYRRTEFATPVRYDGLGTRNGGRPLAKPPGTRRVVLIGDSFVEGLEVAEEATVGRRLEERLTGEGDAPIEVLSVGVAGFGTVQALARLEELGFAYEPDLVVYLAAQNDFGDNVGPTCRKLSRVEGGALVLAEEPVSPLRRLALAVEDRLDASSHLFVLGKWRLRAGRGGRGLYPTAESRKAGPKPWQREVMRLCLERLRDRSAARGVPVVAAMIPPKRLEDDDATLAPALAELCAEVGVGWIDLEPAFRREANAGRVTHWVVDGHWTAHGHDVAAAALAAGINF